MFGGARRDVNRWLPAARMRTSGEERLVPTSSRILIHLSRLMIAVPATDMVRCGCRRAWLVGLRRKTRDRQPPLVCRAALGRALAQPTRGAWCCMGKWRFKLGACAPSANAKCCRWLERLVSGPRIAPRSSCSTGAYTLRVAISVAGVLGRATDALGPKHRVSPPAFWIWRLVRALSKAPGDTGRACPLPSSRR